MQCCSRERGCQQAGKELIRKNASDCSFLTTQQACGTCKTYTVFWEKANFLTNKAAYQLRHLLSTTPTPSVQPSSQLLLLLSTATPLLQYHLHLHLMPLHSSNYSGTLGYISNPFWSPRHKLDLYFQLKQMGYWLNYSMERKKPSNNTYIATKWV